MHLLHVRSSRIGGLSTLAAVSLTAILLAPGTAHADAVQVVKVKAVENATSTVYKFEGLPTSLKGGNIQFELTNTGKEPHDLQIVRIDGVHSTADVMKVINTEGGPIPTWLHGNGGINTVGPGGVGRATVNLGAGKYLFICTETNEKTKTAHATAGMAVNVTVTGAKAAALPAATATITAKEYGFETKGLKVGKNIVEFVNAGKELHHFQMFPIAAGKTIADVKTFLAASPAAAPTGPPPVDFEKGVGSSVIEKSEGSELTEITLVAGRYAIACFISDRAGGPPHFTKGMLTEVVIK